ncbi:cobalamin-binding protein [Teredinibacter haidensis]|uniref:cobalamin-binding protein n=1 Tax=Teredinibacter haidensis TaxID=2731755 RepID=UPI0009FAF192|nr:cobalamin-binding protein [Teredinibacter haidensis]
MKKMVCSLLLCLTAVANPVLAGVSVVDDLGREVYLDKPAQRIIALAPHIVENLYSAGAGNKLVGAVDYSDYPEEAKKLPSVGVISAYSLETIVAMKPDLVVVWRSGRGGEVLKKLDALGITAYANDPRSIGDIARDIRQFGILAGTQAKAEKVAAQFEEKMAALKIRNAELPRVRVLYQIWDKPMQTLNGAHLISDVITLCGGSNIFGDAVALAPKISVESVLTKNPQVIVASGAGDDAPPWLYHWRLWPSIEAVKHNRLFSIPPDLIQRNTIRIARGSELMCGFIASVSRPAP